MSRHAQQLFFVAVAAICLHHSSGASAAAETKLSGAEISAALTDVSLYAGETTEQIFLTGGKTAYIEGGSVSHGAWKVDGDQYCSVWPPSPVWACYDVTLEGAVITFISQGGRRYPMRKAR